MGGVLLLEAATPRRSNGRSTRVTEYPAADSIGPNPGDREIAA